MKLRVTRKFIKGASYVSNNDCPIARALKAKGYTSVNVGSTVLWLDRGLDREMYEIADWQEAQAAINDGTPFTVNLKLFTI